MKWFRYTSIVLCFLALLTLTQCTERTYQFNGKVQHISSDGKNIQMILYTDSYEQVCIQADENTLLASWLMGIDGPQLLDGTLVQPSVLVTNCKKVSKVTIDGVAYDTYHAEQVFIRDILEEDAYTLSDGTVLDVRRSDEMNIYQTKDGTQLLIENRPMGPDNVYVGNLLSLDALNDSAKQKISSWYKSRGLLYDLDSEIERAYADYQSYEGTEPFQEYFLSHEIFPSAYNDEIIWFSTNVSKSISQKTGVENRTCAAFYRETGELANMADFFTCSEEDIIIKLLDATLPSGNHRSELVEAFKLEYLNFNQDAMAICFPAGSLPSEEHTLIIHVEYQQIEDILFAWAIPTAQSPT